MHSSNLLWPSQRKLFRQRSPSRTYLPIAVAAGAALALFAAFRYGWI